MNWRHGIHPNNYAIGETEKYYSDMSEKGWELVKCGITLSRFQKTEPKKMRYRVEVVNLKSLEDGHLPEEQIAVYEDCGWEYVISRGYLHIFRAPEGNDAPEFYLEPEQQAATLKGLRKQYRSSLMAPFIHFGIPCFYGCACWRFIQWPLGSAVVPRIGRRNRMGDWFLPVPALGRVQRSMGFYLHQPPVTAYEERHFSGSCAAQSKAHYHPTNHQPTVAHLYTWMCWVRLSKRRTIYYARCIRRSLYFTL